MVGPLRIREELDDGKRTQVGTRRRGALMRDRDCDRPPGGSNDEPESCALDVLHAWRGILAFERPWSSMPLDDIDGCMRGVLAELLDDDRNGDWDARMSRLGTMAREHGSFRHAQRCSPENLQCEFDVLRYAIESCLGRAGIPIHARRGTLSVLNTEFRVVQTAVIDGWYRPAAAFKRPQRPG